MSSSSSTAATGGGERRLSRLLMWFVCVATVFCSVVALFARWHWIAELFTHFRLYYLLAQALLVMVFLNTRRFAWLAAILLLVIPNAWYVGPYLLPLAKNTLASSDVSPAPQVLVINLSYRNNDHERLLRYVAERDPQIVLLAEYTPDWDRLLSARLVDYPHRFSRPRRGPFGMAVYSRQPLGDVESLDLGVTGSENVRFRARLGGQEFTVFSVHLFPPITAQRARDRQIQLRELATAINETPGLRLVAGDMNLTPFSPLFPDLLRATGLVDARRKQGLQVSWPSAPIPLWIPIDHCLADPHLAVLDVRVGPAVGSDHYPLEITLEDGF